MTADPNVDFSEPKLFYLGTGLIYRTVCAPTDWNGDKVADVATNANPPGTSANRWEVTNPETIDDDENPFKASNPLPCNDCEGRRHWLLNC